MTIYRGIKKLRPGHTLTISTQDGGQQKENEYWSLDQCIDKSKQEPITNYLDAQRLFEETMDQVLAEQMAMDVPYGAFLSGGIDSSLIVALMQKRSQTAIKTYTIGFEQPEYNEAVYAKEVAAHLKTHHTELYVSSKDCLEVIPNLPTIYDEPFSDSSQIPTFLVSNMTRNHVTVALSGDGGDEVFGGYNRHFLVPQILGKTKFLPQHLSQILGGSIKQFSPQGWNRLGRVLKLGHSAFGDKIYKMADVLESNDLSEIYSKLTGHWDSDLVINSNQGQMGELCFNSVHTASEKLMVADFLNYLPNDILTKVDRAAMSVSLETRIPFLDRRIIELAWRMPLEHKIKNGVGKRILRDVLQKYVPTSLTDRPKTGFGIPLDSWLRHDLKDWAESLISKKKITEQGHLSYPMIKAAWDDHQSGASNKQFHLWDVLMFQSWLEGQ